MENGVWQNASNQTANVGSCLHSGKGHGYGHGKEGHSKDCAAFISCFCNESVFKQMVGHAQRLPCRELLGTRIKGELTPAVGGQRWDVGKLIGWRGGREGREKGILQWVRSHFDVSGAPLMGIYTGS